MQCPKCESVLIEEVTTCPYCGYDLSAYRTFNAMKDDLARLRTKASSVLKQADLLQQRFAQFETLFVGERPQTGTPITLQQPPQPPTPASPTKAKPKTQQAIRTSEIKFGQKWLLIAGVITTVLAVGWFLKYSFDQNWVGPAGRVALAYLGGIVFLGGGEFFRRKDFFIFGLYLIGGGIAILYFATFAAFQIYHLIAQPTAFGVMILVTILAGTLALIYDTKWLAVLGLIGGFLTPVILSTGEDNQFVLMTYMTILNAGILTIAFFKQWRLLNYLGFFFTWLLFSGWYLRHYEEYKFWPTIIFLNIFFLTYAFVPFVYHTLRSHHKRVYGLGLLVPNSFIGLGYSFVMIEEYARMEYVSIVTIVYTVIFLWMAQFIYRRDPEQIGAFVLLIAKGMLFLVLTVPILFSEHWITLFWAIQAIVLLWAALKLHNKWLYGSFVVLVMLTLAKFFLYDYDEVFRLYPSFHFGGGYPNLLVERLITSAAVLAMLLIAALMVTKIPKQEALFQGRDTPFLWGALIIALFLVLNIEVAAFFYDYAPQARFASISVLWTLFSLVLIVFGFGYNLSILRRCALGLFAVTMLKVFLVDMANVSTPYRVISFLVLGLMLIGASYLYHRFKDRILPADSEAISAESRKSV